MFNTIILLSAIVVAVLGACDNPTSVADLDRKQYAGEWMGHVAAGNPIFPINPCLTLEIGENDADKVKLGFKTGEGKAVIEGEVVSSSGGDFKTVFGGKKLLYKVLATDYKTHAVIYMCDEDTGNGNIAVHMRSRTPDATLLEEKLAAAQKLLSKPLSPRTESDHSKC
ncbi:unnamed protein product [Acanthoscelides obtectus]|uniref:Lipocalin/cytosolic fatty-acid binding domain-containing protein n=2 Tax=Acanthoscelides obtectus TaxID=200917 RepID=A0A9P0K285_ACAOB|nr:unnamed protein product [Acanthoscelides obtectus]